MKGAFTLFALAYASCGGATSEQPQAPRETSAAVSERVDAGSAVKPQGPDCTQRAPLALKLEPQVSPDGIGLSVINRGPSAVRLARSVALVAPAGSVVNANALALSHTCAVEECTTLEPGGELLSPPWLGQSDGERCGAPVRPSQSGSYELVVRSCDECPRDQRVAVEWRTP